MRVALASWNFRLDVIAVVVLLTTVYVTGWGRLRKRNPRSVRKFELGLYLSSQAAICLALISPVDTLGGIFFTAHMIQHELMMMIAAPLLLLSNPLPVFFWGLPRNLRLKLGGFLVCGSVIRRTLMCTTRITIALPLYLLTLWGWHYPPAFEAALRNDLVHDLQHISFYLAGLIFWWPVINPAPKVHGPIPYGFRIFYVLAAALPTMLPVMALVLTERILYAYYTAVPRLWGITVLGDQSNGWSIMALAEGTTYLIAVLLLLAKLGEHEERVERLRERPLLRTNAPSQKSMLLLLTFLGFLAAQPTAWANGGTPRLTGAIVGPYTVSVWTKPEPSKIGRIHVSVAVLHPQDGAPILDARVRVAADSIDAPEHLISANASRSWGLLYDADLEIPSEGRWRIIVHVVGTQGEGSTSFELEVRPPPKVNRWVVGAIAVLVALAAWWLIRHGGSRPGQGIVAISRGRSGISPAHEA